MNVGEAFEIAGGSVVGREHVTTGRNNQDAFCWSAAAEGIVAVVADGCGSGRYSETGAQIGARVLTEALRRTLPAFDDEDATRVALEQARVDVLAHIDALILGMGGSRSHVVSDYFLFTALGFVLAPRMTTVFGIGDGVLSTDGNVRRLTATDNQPPYLGYALVESSFADDAVRFVVHRRVETAELRSVLVGTDGITEMLDAEGTCATPGGTGHATLAELWSEDRYFANPYTVGRRLNQMNRVVARPNWAARRIETQGGRLPDDATLVVARRARR